jgi:hypothetical protein
MADTFQDRYRQSVRCLICARPARRGAKLCAQCTAGLRRARQTPNVKTHDLPQARAVRTDTRRSSERNASYSRAARRASRAAATPPLGGWGTYATIIAFGLAVCLTGYVAIGDNDRFYVGRAAATAPAAAPNPATVEGREEAVAKTPRPPMPSLAVAVDAVTPSSLAADSEAFYDTVADEHLAIFESLAPAPRAIPGRKAAREGKGAKTIAAQVAATGRSAGTGFRAPAVAPVGVVPVEVAMRPESIASDRLEQFASALGRCERENVIVGLVCKERARLQYCEGQWGVAPECPAAVLSLNSR